MLKGGHEAPTKPKGRPKKNSIPTTEEIEAQERLAAMLAEEERLRQAQAQTQAQVQAQVQAQAQAQVKAQTEAPGQLEPQSPGAQGHLYQAQPQDLSTGSGAAESHSPPGAGQGPATREQQLLMPLSSPQPHAAS